MSKNKFTPGPWELITDEEEMYYVGGGYPFVKVADNRYIVFEGRNAEEAIANAALTSAAPELLEALELIIKYCHALEERLLDNHVIISDMYIENESTRDPEDYAEEVIAKAKGESNV